LRHALWIALVHCQELGFADLVDVLAALLIDVDQRRDAIDAAEEVPT
jgi:hypothetical protein